MRIWKLRSGLLVVGVTPTGNKDAGNSPTDATQLPRGANPLGQLIDLSQHAQAVSAMVRVAMADQAQDPSSVFLAFIGREDVAEDLGAYRFDGDSVRSSREQQGLLLVSRFVG